MTIPGKAAATGANSPNKNNKAVPGGGGSGGKRAVPISLKCCADCGQMFPDHATNLSHWKENHPEKEVFYR